MITKNISAKIGLATTQQEKKRDSDDEKKRFPQTTLPSFLWIPTLPAEVMQAECQEKLQRYFLFRKDIILLLGRQPMACPCNPDCILRRKLQEYSALRRATIRE